MEGVTGAGQLTTDFTDDTDRRQKMQTDKKQLNGGFRARRLLRGCCAAKQRRIAFTEGNEELTKDGGSRTAAEQKLRSLTEANKEHKELGS